MPKTLDELRGVIADDVIDAAIEASALLRSGRIPHVLAGGLAVAAYGYPRATADVDFLVDDRAFGHHGLKEGRTVRLIVTLRVPVVAIGGVRINYVSLPDQGPFVRAALDDVDPSGTHHQGHAAGLVPLELLIYMKLRAGRMRDLSDVAELYKRGALDPDRVFKTLTVMDLGLANKWLRVKEQAEGEAE